MLADGTQPPDYVTITLPGEYDIIRIPFLDTPELRRQRIQRMKAAVSPVPEFLQWIPDWINWIDDIQDLLFVTLTLGRTFAKPLLMRAIPYLGWALAANDILNLANALLVTAQGTRFPKRHILDTVRQMRRGRSARITAATAFLSEKTRWLPFTLQAGQVLHNFTGYGLQLGTLMGAATDSIWAAFRAAQGKEVRIIPPPPADPLGKAARVTSQTFLLPYLLPSMDWDLTKLIVAGLSAAYNWLTDRLLEDPRREQTEQYGEMKYPGYNVWNPTSREALLQEGWTDDELNQPPQWANTHAPTMHEATRRSILANPNLDSALAERAPHDLEASRVQTLAEGAIDDAWSVYLERKDPLEPLNTPWERMLTRTYHENAFPPWMVEDCPSIPLTPAEILAGGRPRNQWKCRRIYLTFLNQVCTKVLLPRMYPPIFADKGWQLAWWLQIALTLRCYRRLWYPRLRPPGIPTCNITHIQRPPLAIASRQRPSTYTDPAPSPGEVAQAIATVTKEYLSAASVLVWGNIWSQDLTELDLNLPRRPPIKYCVLGPEQVNPKLEGELPERLELTFIRTSLPPWPDYPSPTEAIPQPGTSLTWVTTQDRDPTEPVRP